VKTFKCDTQINSYRGQKLENEIVVKKKGQTTIPAKTRKKFKIEEGTKLQLIETEDSIILKPKKSFWDMLGAYSEFGTPEEVKKELDKLRHEDE
jgi:AbrB family looped-hinge helix DNA binding protein